MTERDHELEQTAAVAYRFALSLTHDPDAARNIVQDVLARLIERRGPWHDAYVVRCVRNAFIDEHRRIEARQLVPIDSVPENDVSAVEPSWYSGDPGLQRALGLLDERARSMLYLNVVEGYTADEIGMLFRLPRGTVLSLLARTKKRLRSILEESV